MSEALFRVENLRTRSTRDDILNALWDLRDDAYDRPAAWEGFTAELLFQALADKVDRAADDAIDWDAFGSLVAAVLKTVVEWSAPGTRATAEPS